MSINPKTTKYYMKIGAPTRVKCLTLLSRMYNTLNNGAAWCSDGGWARKNNGRLCDESDPEASQWSLNAVFFKEALAMGVFSQKPYEVTQEFLRQAAEAIMGKRGLKGIDAICTWKQLEQIIGYATAEILNVGEGMTVTRNTTSNLGYTHQNFRS